MDNRSIDDFVREISETEPDIVGFTTLTYSWDDTRQLIEATKSRLDVTAIVGGPHVTSVRTQVLNECEAIDFGLIGEAETTLPILIRSVMKGGSVKGIPGLIYDPGGGQVSETPESRLVTSLDDIPFPAWNLLDLSVYHSPYAKSGRLVPVMSSRGCPFSCEFCAVRLTEGETVRFRSPTSVVDELAWLNERYGSRDVVFNDSVFTLNKKRTISLLEEIRNRRLDVRWMCSTRIDCIDKELLDLMHDSGCFRTYFGIESGSPDVLRSIGKRINLEQVKRRIGMAKSAGIVVEAGFIVGFPWDTISTVKQTIDFALGLDCDDVQFSFYLPLPGTPLSAKLRKHGWQSSFEGCGFHTSPAIIPEGWTEARFKHIIEEAYEEFGKRRLTRTEDDS